MASGLQLNVLSFFFFLSSGAKFPFLLYVQPFPPSVLTRGKNSIACLGVFFWTNGWQKAGQRVFSL